MDIRWYRLIWQFDLQNQPVVQWAEVTRSAVLAAPSSVWNILWWVGRGVPQKDDDVIQYPVNIGYIIDDIAAMVLSSINPKQNTKWCWGRWPLVVWYRTIPLVLRPRLKRRNKRSCLATHRDILCTHIDVENQWFPIRKHIKKWWVFHIYVGLT